MSDQLRRRPSEPRWRGQLAFRVPLHDVAVAGFELLGGPDAAARVEGARIGVVDAIDAALAAGVPEAEIDAELARLREEAARLSPGRGSAA